MSEEAVRERILEAAFTAFVDNGYAATSTAEIASRARVSKRELYTLVGNKQEMLIACISERANRLHLPSDLPEVRDRETLVEVLKVFGARLVHEITDPTVVAAFRLAIAEAPLTPAVAEILDSIGRETSRNALRSIMAQAKKAGVLNGRPAELAELFGALLLRDLQVSLLLGVTKRPSGNDIAKRAGDAAAAFVQLST